MRSPQSFVKEARTLLQSVAFFLAFVRHLLHVVQGFVPQCISTLYYQCSQLLLGAKEYHMPDVNVHGVNLYYEEYGQSPAVILTPGGRVDV